MFKIFGLPWYTREVSTLEKLETCFSISKHSRTSSPSKFKWSHPGFFGFPHKNCSLSSATPAVSSSSIHSPQKLHHISCTRWNGSDVEDHAWQPHDLPHEQMKLWTVQVLCFCSGLSPKLRPYVSPLSYVWGVQPWQRIALPREAIAPANKNDRESPILGYMNESDYICANVNM